MIQIDVLFNSTESHYFRLNLTCINKQHTHTHSCRDFLSHSISFSKYSHEDKVHVMFSTELYVRRGWSEIWKCGSFSNRWQGEKWGYFRHGSFAPLLRSPGGRLACIATPPSHPPPGEPCFDRCCPCCPVKCTCGSTEKFKKSSKRNKWRLRKVGTIECILTLYHREYSRAHITSSRTTRCHDTSSPVECWKTSSWIGFVMHSWLV